VQKSNAWMMILAIKIAKSLKYYSINYILDATFLAYHLIKDKISNIFLNQFLFYFHKKILGDRKNEKKKWKRNKKKISEKKIKGKKENPKKRNKRSKKTLENRKLYFFQTIIISKCVTLTTII
jgi:hypothetical protein